MHRTTPSSPLAGHRSGGAGAITVAAIAAAAALTLSCGDCCTEPAPQPPAPVATSLTVTPASAEFAALGETVQLAAEVRDQTGQAMAGAPVTWSSSDAAVVTVGAAGLVTAAGNGSATVTATSGSASGTAAVTVAQRVDAVAVLPDGESVVERDTVRFEARATDANAHPVAGTGFSWASSDTLVAVVDDAGLVTGVGAGEAEVTATADGVTGRAGLTVMAAVPTTLTVVPDTASFASLGDTVRLVAEVRDQLGRAMEGESVAWSSGDTRVANVDAAGLVTAVGNGAATVTATAGEASDQVAVSVEQRTARVAVAPVPDTLVPGDTVRLTAEATDANGHLIADAVFAWSSSDTQVATVDAAGLVTATGLGAAVVSAAVDEIDGSVAIAVESPVWVAFIGDSVRLVEGETRNVGIRYRVRRLAAALPIRVAAIDDGVEPADYALPETRFDIPAGSGLEGTLELTVGAVTDDLFAEGEERLSLRLAAPEESGAEVGSGLHVAIADAPVAACVGVTLAGTPPEPVEDGRNLVRAALTLEWGPEAADVHLEWAGPYPTREEWIDVEHHPYFRPGISRPNQPGFHLSDWRIESNGGAARHTMSLEWPADDALSLRLRSPRGACDSEPVASCGPDGCSLERAAGTGPGARRTPTPKVVVTASSFSPPAMLPPTEVAPSMEVAGYHLASCQWGPPATTGNVQRWSPAAWPPGDTLEWFVSRANWPTDAVQPPESLGAWIQRSVFDQFSEIPTADARMRIAGVRAAHAAPEPTRDGVNTIHLTAGHGGTHIYGDTDPETGCFEVTESDIAIGGGSWVDRTDAQLADVSMSHDFGHALRLEHAGTFPVRRWSSADPWGRNWEQWQVVSGAWPLDPSMSYGLAGSGYVADESGSFLGLDDKIGISLARPRPGWLARTGSISGRIQADGSPKPFVHVWALLPSTDGRMDGVGAFADERGDFRIEGLPAGDYYLWAGPDLEWLANPWFFLEGQGELLDILLPFPVRVAAGRATSGIEINMRSGRPAALIK